MGRKALELMDDVKRYTLDFEAVKYSMAQNKDGVKLTLLVHPSDCPQDLMSAWVGDRFQVVMVRLNDDDTPSIPLNKEEGERAVVAAGFLCRDERFQKFLSRISSPFEDEIFNSEDASRVLREQLQIESRADLKTNESARKKFNELKNEFELAIRKGLT